MNKFNLFMEMASDGLQAALVVYKTHDERDMVAQRAKENDIGIRELTQESLDGCLVIAQKIRDEKLYAGDAPRTFYVVNSSFFTALSEEKQDTILRSFSPIYRFDLA